MIPYRDIDDKKSFNFVGQGIFGKDTFVLLDNN